MSMPGNAPCIHLDGEFCNRCFKPETNKTTEKHYCSNNKFLTNWINAKEKIPEKDGRYLVVEDHNYKWVGVSTMRQGKFDMPIKYWMPLPEAP